jgi:hypothetical protein
MRLILYRWNFVPTKEEMDFVRQKFNDSLIVPQNFTQTVVPFEQNSWIGSSNKNRYSYSEQPPAQINSQTTAFCDRLNIDDPMALLLNSSKEMSFDSIQVGNTWFYHTFVSFSHIFLFIFPPLPPCCLHTMKH